MFPDDACGLRESQCALTLNAEFACRAPQRCKGNVKKGRTDMGGLHRTLCDDADNGRRPLGNS